MLFFLNIGFGCIIGYFCGRLSFKNKILKKTKKIKEEFIEKTMQIYKNFDNLHKDEGEKK